MPVVVGEVDTPNVRDGSLRGVTGPLVKIPVPNFVSSVNGAATVAQGVTGTTGADNPDGTGTQVNIAVPAALGNNARLSCEVYGRTIGIRFLRRNITTIFGFDVVIDGVAYPVESVTPRRGNVASTASDYEGTIIVATDLSDTVHTVEIYVHPDPALASTNSVFLFGFVVEQGHGYNPPAPAPHGGFITGPVTLTNAVANISTSPSQTFVALTFHNTDVVQRTVTVRYTDNATIYRVLALPAGTSGQISFPAPRVLNLWKWLADASGVVTAWAENS